MLGIIFALIAMVGWAFGDFYIQKTSREYGVWASLFCVVFLGSTVLFPFVIKSLPLLFETREFLFLIIVSVISCIAAMISFKAFQTSKMTTVEPIMSFELPLTILLGVFVLSESLSSAQLIIAGIAFIGILLTSSKNIFKSSVSFEKGVSITIVAVLFMSIVNFITGIASQKVGAVETIWFVHTFIAIICIIYFSVTRSWRLFFEHVQKYPKESLLVALFNNGAWLAYSAAVILIPISLAITISEGYIALAMILGVIFNKEKLSPLQWLGAIISFVAVLVLAFISG